MVLSVNSLALWSVVGAVGLSTAGVFLPAGEATLLHAHQNATQASAAKKPFALQLGRLQLRMVPKETATPSPSGMNGLSYAVLVVAGVALASCLISFLHSVFEEHATKVAELEANIAELKAAEVNAERAEALATELDELKASITTREEELIRTNVCHSQGGHGAWATPPAAPTWRLTPLNPCAGAHRRAGEDLQQGRGARQPDDAAAGLRLLETGRQVERQGGVGGQRELQRQGNQAGD